MLGQHLLKYLVDTKYGRFEVEHELSTGVPLFYITELKDQKRSLLSLVAVLEGKDSEARGMRETDPVTAEKVATAALDEVAKRRAKLQRKLLQDSSSLPTRKKRGKKPSKVHSDKPEVTDQSNFLFCCPAEGHLHLLRSALRTSRGDHQGALDDITQALEVRRLCTQGADPQEDAKFLRSRACSFRYVYVETRNIDCLDDGIADLREAWRLTRMSRRPGIPLGFGDDNMRGSILQFMVMKKVHGNPTRPHYTSEELQAIEDDLGIFQGMFCHECGAHEDRFENLVCCDACDKAWYCSEHCRTLAWDARHNMHCQEDTVGDMRHLPLLFFDSDREHFQAKTNDRVEVKFFNIGKAYFMLVLDPATGRYFDSLSNRDVYFLPSDQSHLDQLGNDIGITFPSIGDLQDELAENLVYNPSRRYA